MVCDWGDHTVKVLSSDGSQLLLAIRDPNRAIPCNAVCHQNMFYISYPKAGNVKVFSKDGVLLYSICTSESGVRHLSFPAGIAIDRFNNLVVCDRDKARLQLFTLDGKFVNSIEGYFHLPVRLRMGWVHDIEGSIDKEEVSRVFNSRDLHL